MKIDRTLDEIKQLVKERKGRRIPLLLMDDMIVCLWAMLCDNSVQSERFAISAELARWEALGQKDDFEEYRRKRLEAGEPTDIAGIVEYRVEPDDDRELDPDPGQEGSPA